jgi:site-specific DNA-methyltransferase (adenine-specific)
MTVRLGIWEKNNPSPQNGEHLWLSSLESCIYARKSGAQFYEHCSSPVWKYPVVNNSIHATQKPVLLMERLIRASTQPGDLICDPFIGSGTTAVAARNLGRHYIGCDISEEYVAIANKRLALPYTPPLL